MICQNDTPPLSRYSLYLPVGNPYLSDSVDNHTEKLLERFEQLVDLVMQSNDMNHVYVLPQLHTLLWVIKRCIKDNLFYFLQVISNE